MHRVAPLRPKPITYSILHRSLQSRLLLPKDRHEGQIPHWMSSFSADLYARCYHKHAFLKELPNLQPLSSVPSLLAWYDSRMSEEDLDVRDERMLQQLLDDFARKLDRVVTEVSSVMSQPSPPLETNTLLLLSEGMKTSFRLRIWMAILFAHYKNWNSSAEHLDTSSSQLFFVEEVTRKAVDDVRTISTTINGLSPHFRVSVEEKGICCIGPPSFFHFICVEILKNAVTGLLQKFGQLDLDLSPPVNILIGTNQNYVYVRVSDEGNGMNDMEIAKSLNFFFTTHKWRENDSYTYSGNFGAPIAGLGVGLPMSQLYAESFGGSLSLSAGTTVTIFLERNGNGILDPLNNC